MPIIENSNTSRIEGIRRLVAIGYDGTDLPNPDITDDVFLGVANRYVQRKVSNWTSLTGDDQDDLQVAVQKQCAIELLKSASRLLEIDRERTGARMDILSIKDTIEQFTTDVADIIADIVPEASGGAVPHFQVINLQDEYE